MWVERLYFSQQMTHSVFGRAGGAGGTEVLDFTGAARAMATATTGAMMVLASIIDTFVFGFVFVSENCLLDFSWISISIFRIGKSEIVDVIAYVNAIMIIILMMR
jgi:uncharacterized membrane protein YagU involved in acid resistance